MSDYKQIFDAVTGAPRYQRNLDWGEAHPGHPEATVRAHIAEIDGNLEAAALNANLAQAGYGTLFRVQPLPQPGQGCRERFALWHSYVGGVPISSSEVAINQRRPDRRDTSEVPMGMGRHRRARGAEQRA